MGFLKIIALFFFDLFIDPFYSLFTIKKKSRKYKKNNKRTEEPKTEEATEPLLLDSGANKDVKKESKTSICEICGKETKKGYNFCKACFQKQKVKTKTGAYVRSLAEQIIFEYLYDKGYSFNYEEKLYLTNEKNERVLLRPDFCIHKDDKKIYIEYWGYGPENIQYTETKNKKLKLYEQNGITLISINNTERNRIREALEEKLAVFY